MHTRVRQVLARKGHQVHTVPRGTPVSEAARKMTDLKIGSLVVIEKNDDVAGILTERDLARRACGGGFVTETTPVDAIMTSPVAFVTPASTVAEAMKVMSETHCRHLPVMEKGSLAGLISLGDLVRTITADLAADVKYLQDYILKG